MERNSADNKCQRNQGIQLLRIICAMWIIARHLSASAIDCLMIGKGIKINYWLGIIGFIGGDIGNVVFIVVTGYFMYSKKFDIKRWVRVYLELLFYSCLGYSIAFLLGYQKMNLHNVLDMLMPVRKNDFWYISDYLVMFFVFPILNILIQKLNMRQLVFFVFLGCFVFSFLPTMHYKWFSDKNGVCLFILLYYSLSELKCI